MNLFINFPFCAYLVFRESSVVGNGSPTNKRVSYLHPAGFSSQAGMRQRVGEQEVWERGEGRKSARSSVVSYLPSPSPSLFSVHCLLTRLKWISARPAARLSSSKLASLLDWFSTSR